MDNEKLLVMKQKIANLIKLGESEAKIGNEGAAALIADKVSQLMTKFHFEENEFKAAHPEVKYEPIIVHKDFTPHFSSRKISDDSFAYYLASVVAKGYYCKAKEKFSGYHSSKSIRFYGTDFDVDISIMMFEKILNMAVESAANESAQAQTMIGKKGYNIKEKKHVVYPKTWMGDQQFLSSFVYGFSQKLAKNYQKNQTTADSFTIFDRIEAFIKIDSDNVQEIQFSAYSLDNLTVELGKRYGNYTAKQKTDKLHKQSNVELSKVIHRVEKDDRVGEVILVLDDSGSMCYSIKSNSWNNENPVNKIKGAQDGARDFAQDAIKKKFAVGIMKFGSDSHWLADAKLELNGEFDSAINCLNGNSGGTDMFKALTLAATKFNTRMRVKRVIVVVTDGEVSDPNKTIQYANLLKATGIEIMTIGTFDANEEFLKQISSGNVNLMVSDSEIRNALRGAALFLNA